MAGFATSDRGVQAWLLEVARIFQREDLAFPVLLHSDGSPECMGLAVTLLLAIAGVPEALIVKEYLLSDGVVEALAREALAGFRKAGGVGGYLSAAARRGEGGNGDACDVEGVRRRLLAGSEEEETKWLKEELQLLRKNAMEAEKAGDEEQASFWQSETAAAGAELALRLKLGEAAAALFCRGWALSKLEGHRTAAEAALAVGLELGRLGHAKPEVLKSLQKELDALPYDGSEEADSELQVVEIARVADTPGDPHSRLLLLWVPPDETAEGVDEPPATAAASTNGSSAAAGRRPPKWQTFPCPRAFSWLRSGELAAAATPEAKHLPALDALSLKRRVGAQALGAARDGNSLDHWESVVGEVAKALLDGEGCLLHCSSGFGDTGIALACFLVCHGLDEPIREKGPAQPRMTAGEAIEVLRAIRPGCLAAACDEAEVQEFAKAAWGRFMEKAQRAFMPAVSRAQGTGSSAGSGTAAGAGSRVASGTGSGAAASAAPQRALRQGTVKNQPGDGNCLFHSLAYGLGQGTASTLRAEICSFMEKNPDLSIAGTSLSEWIQMLAGSAVPEYARKMAKGSQWGGAPEIAACAHMRQVCVHVYEKRPGGFELTVPFDVQGASKTVSVLYVGGVHYDALIL